MMTILNIIIHVEPWFRYNPAPRSVVEHLLHQQGCHPLPGPGHWYVCKSLVIPPPITVTLG